MKKTWYSPYVQFRTTSTTTMRKRISFELFLFATIVSFPESGISNENVCLFFLKLFEVSFIKVGMIYDLTLSWLLSSWKMCTVIFWRFSQPKYIITLSKEYFPQGSSLLLRTYILRNRHELKCLHTLWIMKHFPHWHYYFCQFTQLASKSRIRHISEVGVRRT